MYEGAYGQVGCNIASPGHYTSNSYGNTIQTACARGYYQALPGQITCDACPAGKYQGEQFLFYYICAKRENTYYYVMMMMMMMMMMIIIIIIILLFHLHEQTTNDFIQSCKVTIDRLLDSNVNLLIRWLQGIW